MDQSVAMCTIDQSPHRSGSSEPRRVHWCSGDQCEPGLIRWDGPDDPQDPYNWPMGKKLWSVGIGLLASFAASSNGTILSVAHEAINADFSVSDKDFPNSYWPTTSWGVGGALFPLILFPFMEDFGVRPVVLGTYFVFICTLIPIGLAPNFATLIIARFFSGGCVQLLSNAVAGIISNVFEDDRARSVPISLYATTYLAATSMGPVFGAAIFKSLSWRWIANIETIWTATLFPVLVIGLPESRGSAILKGKARRLRRKGQVVYTEEELDRVPLLTILVRSVSRPLYMLCTEPVVFVATLWASFSLGIIYLFTQSVEQVYGALYGWTAIQAGYVQAAVVVGEIFGCGLCVVSNQWYYDSASRNTEAPGLPIPEARLYASVIGGSFGVGGGMLIFAWTAFPWISWVAPTVGLAMVGFGTTAVVVSIANYLVDAYSKYAASALGAVGLLENSTIAFLPLAASALYTNLGFHWASTLLAFVSLILVTTPVAVIRWGTKIRRRSPFMKEAAIERLQLSPGVRVETTEGWRKEDRSGVSCRGGVC